MLSFLADYIPSGDDDLYRKVSRQERAGYIPDRNIHPSPILMDAQTPVLDDLVRLLQAGFVDNRSKTLDIDRFLEAVGRYARRKGRYS
jgi:hypothetical protein